MWGARVNLLGRQVRRNIVRHYIGRTFATLAAATLQLPIYDTQCGAKLFRLNDSCRSIFSTKFCTRWVFDVEIIARLIAARRGTQQLQAQDVIYEQPLTHWHEVKGSKLNLADPLLVSWDLIRVYWKYMR